MRKIVWAGVTLICGLLVALMALDFMVFNRVNQLGPELVYQPTKSTISPLHSPRPSDSPQSQSQLRESGPELQSGGVQV